MSTRFGSWVRLHGEWTLVTSSRLITSGGPGGRDRHVGSWVRGTLRSLQRAGEVRQWLTKARGGIDPGDALSFVEAELTNPNGWDAAITSFRLSRRVCPKRSRSEMFRRKQSPANTQLQRKVVPFVAGEMSSSLEKELRLRMKDVAIWAKTKNILRNVGPVAGATDRLDVTGFCIPSCRSCKSCAADLASKIVQPLEND